MVNFKKGNLTFFQNYRRISLTAIAVKIYKNHFSLYLIQYFKEAKMNLGQENLQVLLLERVINKNKWKQRLHYYLCRLQEGIWFINTDVLIETIALYGIPKKIIGVIKGMHTNTSSRVTRLDGKTISTK